MAIVDLKKDYVAGNKTNFGGALGKSTSKKEDSSFLGNLAYIGGNTAAGFGGVFEGIGRLVSSTGAKIAGDDRLARYYAKKSYIGEWQSDMEEKYSPGKVTQFFADAGAGVGQSSVFLLNLVAPGAGTVVFGTGIFGNSVGEAVNKTGQLGFKEYAYGGLSAGGEVLMEVISGATFKAVGRIGAGVTGNLTKNAVETTATQTAKKGFLKAVASNAVLKDLLKESSGEFVEEFLGDFWDVGISRLTGVDPEASTTLGQAIYSGMVGFASGAMMSGSSMVINRAAAASRGYHINESGNAQQMVRTAEVVLEEAKTAENFQDPAGVVDMLKESVESYNAQKDKTNFASRVALGQMQMFTAYIEKNIGVMQAYANIMKADAQTLEKYAQLASYYTNEKVTTRDLLANRDNITTQMAIRDWVNGVLTVDSDLVAEAEVRDFTRTTEGGNTSESTGETRFSMTGDAAKQELKNQLDRNATAAQEAQQTAQATEITQTSFDGGKSVQNVHIIDRMYLSIKKNSDGTYNYAINDKSAKQDANGGVWDKTNVPAEEMRQYFEQAKEGAVQYEAQKAAQTDQETQTGADGKTTVEGENSAQEREGAEKKAQEKPRQKSEIDSATEKKLNKMVKGFNTMAYRDRVAVSRMVKSAEANGVDAKTVKKIAIAMTARSGLDIRFTKSISQNGTWTVFKDGSQRRLILLNPDIQSPLEQTFLHEFMHDMMHDQYTDMKAVMDVTSGMLEEGAFDDYIKERRDEYFDACAKAGREGLILTKNEDGTVTRSFASEKAEKAFDLMMREEATANFGAEFLYRRGFLTRVARSNQKLVLRAFRAIGRWINDVRSRDMETAQALEGYFRTIEDAVRNSKGNSEIASLLFGSKPDAQNANSATDGTETLYSLPAVSPVKPSSQKWKTTIDTAEAKKRFPSLWDVTADESQTRNPTQIRSTVSTYRKIYDILKAEGFSGKILDASSGLGYGTRAGIDEYGFEVDDIEPYPDRSYSPKYTDYSALEGKYDAIISNAVLNVLPQDQRDALVVKMGKLLADGGKLFVNVRGDDVNTLSSNPSNVKIGDMEWFVSSTGSYQKGFTRNELVAYLKDALGNDFEVQGTSKFGKASAIVTKKESATNKSKTGNNTRFELSQFGQYTAEESSSIQRDAKNEIAKSYDDVKRFISDSTSENIQKRLFVGKIDKETAKNILAQTDVYTYGKSIVLTSDDIRHIFDRHGSAFSEGQRGQIAITADNFDSVLRTIMKPDTVKPEVDKSGAISLVFKKEINGNVTAVTVVSEKKKALSLKSAWITVQKEKQHISPPSDVQAPNPTSKTVGSMNAVSDNSIHQNSENVKGKSKIGENTRFELKIGSQTTPVKVQETKNLIAIHNLTEQNLLDTLNLGGFPMPSIAVIKADQGHSEYGDISVIFGKETIDPQINSKNAIYGGDAWTPTYPTIEYKVAEKVADRIRNKYYDLARKFGYDDVRPLYKYANDLEDTLNKAKGEAELISSLVDDEDMMRVFLMDSGKGKIPTVQTEVRTEMSPAEVERAKFFINALGEDVVRGIKTPEGERIGFYRQKYLDEHSDAIRNVYHELLTKEYGATEEEAQRVLENAKRYDLFRIVNDAYHYLENGGVTVRTETDSAASSKAVRDAVDTKQYRTWLKDIFGGIEEKSGIRNERDPFDSRGNRRKWETLHWENTLENVVQAMLEQPDVGKGTIFSATSIWGVSAKEYKTISDMKKDTARLKTMSQQQYDTIRAGFEERLTAIADSIRDVKADNEFIARDNAISAIVEAVRTKKTGSSMLAYLKGYSNRATAQTVKDIISLVRDISDMPTQYFEAKPHRVVNFSEIKMVELPESASDTLKKQLERRKIPYEVYGKTDEDRATAVKKLNDVRFELNSGTGYSRGQMSKIVANRTKGKVYSLSDAAIAIDNVTALVSGILSDENISFRAKIRGKSRAEVMDFLFEQMNKEQGNGRLNTALQAADYILNHAVVQEELDSVGREEYARMMDIITGVESYRRKFKFTETEKADLKHMFDKGYPSLLRAWSSEDGMMPSRILAELKDSGITVDSASDVESDIFADLLGQYQNAKQAIKQWNESVLLNTVGDKRMLTKLKSDMAREILKAFETTGEKSAYRKEVEARQESISKMLEKNRAKLDASRKRSRSEYQLYRAGIDLEQRLKRDKRSNKLFQDVGVREIANAAVKLAKPRNARNPAAVLSFAKTMQGIYSPKNPLLAIYGEVDKKTGEYENTYYNPEVGDALNRLTQIDTEVYRRGKKVKNKYLTDAQVIDLQTVVSGIDRLYREYDTVYYQGKRVGLTETAQQGVDNLLWIEENRNKKGKKWYAPLKNFIGGYLRETVSPLVVVRNLEMHDPNGVLSKYYEEVVRGDLNTRTMTANLMDTFEKFYKENKGYQKALARDTVKFMGFEMSKAQAITLYCTMKSEHARLGFETFGFTYEDKNGNLVETGAIKNYDIKILYNAFNETDKRFISIVEQFFNETSRKIKTETDMRVIGSTNVLEDYYFPILRDRKQRGSNVGDMRKAMMNTLETVNNISANQNRIEHADGRLDIYDVTAIIERHAVAMATYANLYEPIQSFERVLNARVGQRDENGKLIRQTETTIGELMEKLYPGFRDSFTKLFGDIQGVKASREGVWDTVGKGIEKAQGLYASAVVSGNIKTAMLPPMSMFAAGSLIDMKYLSRSLTMNNTRETRKASYAEMEKYSSVIKGRYYDRGAIKARTVQDSVRGLISVTGKGIEITEKFMINKLWSACKLQTSEQLGLAFDSDENCRAAAKLFDKVVTETQSQYVPSMKSSLARHNNVIVRGFTQFKSDGQAMLGSLYDNVRGYFDLKERKKAGQNVDAELKAAKKRAARSIPSIAAVCVGVAIITQGMRYLFNNDDEDDETPVKNIAMNTLNSAMGMFPLVGDVYSVFAEGYDISNMTLDALNDGVNGIKAMTSLIGNDNATQADVARATRKALYGVGHMAGVPVRNLTNLTTGVIRRISKPTMYGYDSIFSGEKYSEDLQRAVKRGDDKMAEAITKVMFRRKKTGAYNQETLDEVLRLYKAGYDKKIMPGGIPDDLTRAQRKTFLNVYGKSDADVQKLIESDAYKAFDDGQKASAISSLYRSWRAYAEYQATGETDDKSALLSEIMGADKFGKARAYLSGLKAKEDAETPKDGWRSTIQKGLKGMGLTSDEQALILYAAGYHSASDLSAFLRVLNAKNLTKEQLALLAEIFKLDVKKEKLVERKTTKKTA